MTQQRRQFLKGITLSGASLAMAPFLRSVYAQASGKHEQLPKRFVFVVKSSGIDKFNLVPEGLENHYVSPKDGKKLGNKARRHGPLVDVSLGDHKLPKKLAQLEAFKERMGWTFKWVSSLGNDFNRDYDVSFTEEELAAGPVFYNYAEQGFPATEAPGISVFYKDGDGAIYHTYSCFGRGLDALNGTYQHLDRLPKGDAVAITRTPCFEEDGRPSALS